MHIKKRKEVILRNLTRKGLVFSVIFGFLLTCLPYIQAQDSTKNEAKKVNINTAPLSELQKLPRIGPNVAQRIIDFRKEHGNFKKIEEIMKVKGIGEKIFKKIKDLITVGEKAKAQ